MVSISKIKVEPAGQITLDTAVLHHLGAEVGDALVIELLPDGRAEVRKGRTGSITDFIGCLSSYAGPSLTIEEIREESEKAWAGEP